MARKQDQGTQFEWCVLHTAYSRLTNPEVLSSKQLKTKEKALETWNKTNSTVQKDSVKVVDKLAKTLSANESLKFYSSFFFSFIYETNLTNKFFKIMTSFNITSKLIITRASRR